MYLIETYPNETEAEFRSAVEELLTHLWDEPKKDWWHPFEVGDLYRYGDRMFRVFDCPAGSVSMHVYVKADKGGIDRAILFLGKTFNKKGKEEDMVQLIVKGKKIAFNPAEVEKVDLS